MEIKSLEIKSMEIIVKSEIINILEIMVRKVKENSNLIEDLIERKKKINKH